MANRGPIHLKLVVLGDQYVGKTSVIERYVYGKFDSCYTVTLAGHFSTKFVNFEDRDVKLLIFDTAGQEDARTVIRSLYRDAHGILLVFDCARRDTLDHVTEWMELLKQNCFAMPEVVLAGNKCDLPNTFKAVNRLQGEELAGLHQIPFFEISAKHDLNVKEAFQSLVHRVLSIRGLTQSTRDVITIRKTDASNKSSSTCC
ncbi:hypothetical protein ACJMK2_024490 [Sinanodonta woodiana]|uniref:Uncharacterized protein n=1 Tax=Sinanodonta woodiana TaxID=1069815 RepID=A0ABD3XFY1_SINWO